MAWVPPYGPGKPNGDLPPALYAKLSASGTQRHGALRYMGGRRAPSRCSTEPNGLKCTGDSAYQRMKKEAQVNNRRLDPKT